MPLYLGLDIGTSATKALLIDEFGAVRATGEAGHSIQMPRPGWSEQNPDEWWRAAIQATRTAVQESGASANEIDAIGLSGQMHGSVFLPSQPDPDDPQPLRPALLWNDQRTAAQCAAITDAVGVERLLEISGNRALTGFTAPKLLWLRDEEPELFQRLGLLLLPKDYVRFRMTGMAAIDVGDASGTLLLDLQSRTWSAEILKAIGLDQSILPPVIESAAEAGMLRSAAASALGLREGTPVIAGSGDQMTGAVGMGIVKAGLVSATLGTSGVIFAHAGSGPPSLIGRGSGGGSSAPPALRSSPTHRPPPSKGRGVGGDSTTLQSMCAAVPGEYCMYGCMLSGAGAFQWFRSAGAPGISFAQLDEEAAKSPPGAEGLLFLPYLTGERCPFADPLARGAFIGLTSRHTRGHMARAVMEGVAFGMAQMLDLARSLSLDPAEMRVSGGGAKSKLWRGILAAACDMPATTLNTSEGSAYGAALLAGAGVGAWSSVIEACERCISPQALIEPDPAVTDQYREIRSIFASLYPTLRSTFAILSSGAEAQSAPSRMR